MDLGATNVRAALVDRAGRVRGETGPWPHGNRDLGSVLDVVEWAVESVRRGRSREVGPAGISVAAQVDPIRGVVVHAPNLRWRHVPLGRNLERRLGIPFRLVNDARAATYAEWRFGAGRGESDLFVLVVGTGVGGSAVVGGRLLEGYRHAAGEVGHLPIVAGGRSCTCPGRGCFEAYVGGWAIAERAREAARARPAAARRLVARAGGVSALRAETLFAGARAGDPWARRLVAETEGYFADGVVGVVNAFNPSLLVLSGAVVRGWPRLVRVAARAVRSRCQPPAASARVVLSPLGDRAAAVGAAALGRRAVA